MLWLLAGLVLARFTEPCCCTGVGGLFDGSAIMFPPSYIGQALPWLSKKFLFFCWIGGDEGSQKGEERALQTSDSPFRLFMEVPVISGNIFGLEWERGVTLC